jgi:aromatic-L-amino-acid/L-tryptophan decarboxylase
VHEALDDAARILDESIAQPRPRYFAFIGSSGLEIGAIADLLAHTYDINLAVDARAATALERQAVEWVGGFVGFPVASGAFTSGGTISNVTALAAARERALPGSRATGLGGLRVAVYASAEVHYSVTRAVELLGIGSDNLRDIPIDDAHRMQARELATAIDRDIGDGVTPIAVIATAGTTLTGAIDPITELADVCVDRGVWLHVDGAYGLPAAATDARRGLFAGLERADSASIDVHKWMYLPKACGVVLVREPRMLEAAFAHEQGYLPHQQHELHAVDITLEYSRPFRALKLWLALRAHGAGQFRDAIQRNLHEAELLYERAASAADFRVLDQPPQLSIVPIRHEPEGVEDLDGHNQQLADAIQEDGRVYLASALIDEQVWLRPCFVNFRTTDDDVLAIVDVARELGERIARGAS